MNRYNVAKSDILLVHDHLDKRLGKIQIKLDGSAGCVISCLLYEEIVTLVINRLFVTLMIYDL